MGSSVVRVDDRTHATLRAWADSEHKPIGQIVAELVEHSARARYWAGLRNDYARLKADSAGWAGYVEELRSLEGGSLDGLTNEEPYYSPEEAAEIAEHARSQGW